MGAEQMLKGGKTPVAKPKSSIDPVAIIKQSAQEAGMDPDQALRIAAGNIKQGSKLVSAGKTLMFFKKINDTTASSFFLSADKGTRLQKSLDQLILVLEKSGIQIIYTNTQNKNIINEFANIGIVFSKSDQQKFKYMAKLK